MIPIRIQIINNKQKRAALVGCTLFAFMGFMVAMCFLLLVSGETFKSYLTFYFSLESRYMVS